MESIEDGLSSPMELEDDESWHNIDDLGDESEDIIEGVDTEPVANRNGVSAQAEADIEVEVEDENDEALLDAQLQGADTPQVDFAYKLGRHLLHFKGCSLEEHFAMVTL
jgi:hypothetical protein